VDFLPEMGSEDLDQRDLQGRDLAVHENTRQVKLDLETNVHVRTVDRRRPPQCESTIWDLVQTRSLGMSKFFVSHALLETASLLPEETFPSGEVSALEQGVFKDTYNTT
jgi:hypothetical protein